MKISSILMLAVLISTVFLSGCSDVKSNKNEAANVINSDVDSSTYLISSSAPQWAAMLKHDSGWIGADGIYAVPMNGVESHGKASETNTLFWFSDCILGNIKSDTLVAGREMMHNSVAYMKGDNADPNNIQFHWRKDSAGNALSMFEPNTPMTQAGDYYWLGDGFFSHAMDSTIYIFAYRIKNVPGGIYPFDDVGLSLIAIPKGSKPPFTNQRQLDVPFFLKDSKGKGKVVFGISVMPNTKEAGALLPDGYIYVYGVRGGNKELLVSRVKADSFESFDSYTFWDGSNWNPDINSAAALTKNISNEMSVSLMDDGRVLAVYQLGGNTSDIVMQVGKTPWGPFQPAKKIWETPEIYEGLDFYTYNAKAHPHLSKPGELLISYNLNSFNFLEDITRHPYHLRPRFFTFKYK